jgi:hypothetical protein
LGRPWSMDFHARTAPYTCRTQTKARQTSALCPFPLRGNVVAQPFSLGEYLVAKKFENTFSSSFLQRAPFQNLSFTKTHIGRMVPLPRFSNNHFLYKWFFPKLNFSVVPTYSMIYLRKGVTKILWC